MATKNYPVIDQYFAAQVACNESETTMKSLRPQVEQAVQALIAEKLEKAHPESESIKHGLRLALV